MTIRRLRKEINGVRYSIRENELFLEYIIDGELVLGKNKENGAVLVKEEELQIPLDESDLNLMTIDEIREFMMADLNANEVNGTIAKPSVKKSISKAVAKKGSLR